MNYKFSGTFILLLAGLLVLTIIFGSWYTIDQTQRGVLLRNGALVEVVQPGLHFKWPWIEAVNKVDMQTHNFTFEKVNSYSADQQPADLRISVTLHVAPDKVAEMYSRFAGDQQAAISRLITPHINQEVKVVFGQYTAQRAITARGSSTPTPPRRSTTRSPTIRSSSSKACRSKTSSSRKITSARSKPACRRRSPSSNASRNWRKRGSRPRSR